MLDPSHLDALLPAGPLWADFKEHIQAVWSGDRAQTYKPNTMLVVFAGDKAGEVAHARLGAAAAARGPECVLQLDAPLLDQQDRGLFQATLAEFLRWAGGGWEGGGGGGGTVLLWPPHHPPTTHPPHQPMLCSAHLRGTMLLWPPHPPMLCSAHPRGTVLLTNVDGLPFQLVPVLINALSEQGAFQHQGKAVPTKVGRGGEGRGGRQAAVGMGAGCEL